MGCGGSKPVPAPPSAPEIQSAAPETAPAPSPAPAPVPAPVDAAAQELAARRIQETQRGKLAIQTARAEASILREAREEKIHAARVLQRKQRKRLDKAAEARRSDAAAQTHTTRVTLKMRAEADMNSDVVGEMPANSCVTVREWCVLPDGTRRAHVCEVGSSPEKTGWLSCVAKDGAETLLPTTTASLSTSQLLMQAHARRRKAKSVMSQRQQKAPAAAATAAPAPAPTTTLAPEPASALAFAQAPALAPAPALAWLSDAISAVRPASHGAGEPQPISTEASKPKSSRSLASMFEQQAEQAQEEEELNPLSSKYVGPEEHRRRIEAKHGKMAKFGTPTQINMDRAFPGQIATMLNVLRFVDAINAMISRPLIDSTADGVPFDKLMSWHENAITLRFSSAAQYLRSGKKFGLLGFDGEYPMGKTVIYSKCVGQNRQSLLGRALRQPSLIVPYLSTTQADVDKLGRMVAALPDIKEAVDDYLDGDFDEDMQDVLSDSDEEGEAPVRDQHAPRPQHPPPMGGAGGINRPTYAGIPSGANEPPRPATLASATGVCFGFAPVQVAQSETPPFWFVALAFFGVIKVNKPQRRYRPRHGVTVPVRVRV